MLKCQQSGVTNVALDPGASIDGRVPAITITAKRRPQQS